MAKNEYDTLPWQHLKSEDPRAVKLVKKLKSTRIAEDLKFINSNEARNIRLEIDYQKVELAMKSMGIMHTVVVFGSARIVEYSTAKKRLSIIEDELDKNPADADLRSKLSIAQKMLEKSVYYDDARKLGTLIGSSGQGPQDCKVTVMTGGGPGIMEAANRGAFDVGAKSIGMNIELPHEQFPNPYITPELCFELHYFAIRKLHFFIRAKALVVYPGGFGTLDELFELLTLVQTKKTDAIPIVLVSKYYWNRVINFTFLQEEGVIGHTDLDIFKIVNNADEAWDYIVSWYKNNNEPLFGD